MEFPFTFVLRFARCTISAFLERLLSIHYECVNGQLTQRGAAALVIDVLDNFCIGNSSISHGSFPVLLLAFESYNARCQVRLVMPFVKLIAGLKGD
jgi:hypothetical protein